MEEMKRALERATQNLFGLDIQVELTRPDEQFGDYATNVALQLAGKLRRKPREVAEELASSLREDLGDRVKEVSIAGPGFINIRLSDAALTEQAEAAPVSRPDSYKGKTIVIEYSDPNPFKPLHAGHLYTTLVGDSISRLVEASGAKTIRINYGGDVGLHAGKSMWSIVKYLDGELPEKLAEVLEGERAAWLGARYVEGNKAYEDDEAAKAEIVATNKRIYQLHEQNDRESPFAQIYWTCRQWSYDYFAGLYKQLEVMPFDRFIPESEVTPLGVQTVREQLERGVYTKSDNAVVFKGEEFGLHTRVFINSEGLPTYETKDVGLSLTKWRDYHFDESIIITANEQAQYMQVVIASIKQFAPEPAERTTHLTHGVVKFKGGAKFSSRKGNAPLALDILEAARQAGAVSEVKHSEESIMAAVKYAFARNRIGSDIHYDPEESVSLEGSSGPYLQYAHARARSILKKSSVVSRQSSVDFDPAERSLGRKVSEYPEVLQKAVGELMPHHICTYLYELAQEFNRFYEKSKVIGDPRQNTRLKLVQLYVDTLKDGLTLLGITAPERM
jgi:arginyl-tRNA synthetase